MSQSRWHPKTRTGALATLATVLFATSAARPVSSQAPPSAPPAPTVEGVWIDHTGRGAVEIKRCGASLCGNIIWLQAPKDKHGRSLLDGNNPDRARRNHPICGLQVIGEMKAMRGGVWDEGWIYDPEKGERFSLELRLKDASTLQVMGYLGIKLLSETYEWKRATAEPPRCTS